MFTFEVGKTYFTTSACDSNCIFKVEIVKRTAKTVTFRRDGKERRAKIYTGRRGVYHPRTVQHGPRVPGLQ